MQFRDLYTLHDYNQRPLPQYHVSLHCNYIFDYNHFDFGPNKDRIRDFSLSLSQTFSEKFLLHLPTCRYFSVSYAEFQSDATDDVFFTSYDHDVSHPSLYSHAYHARNPQNARLLSFLFLAHLDHQFESTHYTRSFHREAINYFTPLTPLPSHITHPNRELENFYYTYTFHESPLTLHLPYFYFTPHPNNENIVNVTKFHTFQEATSFASHATSYTILKIFLGQTQMFTFYTLKQIHCNESHLCTVIVYISYLFVTDIIEPSTKTLHTKCPLNITNFGLSQIYFLYFYPITHYWHSHLTFSEPKHASFHYLNSPYEIDMHFLLIHLLCKSFQPSNLPLIITHQLRITSANRFFQRRIQQLPILLYYARFNYRFSIYFDSKRLFFILASFSLFTGLFTKFQELVNSDSPETYDIVEVSTRATFLSTQVVVFGSLRTAGHRCDFVLHAPYLVLRSPCLVFCFPYTIPHIITVLWFPKRMRLSRALPYLVFCDPYKALVYAYFLYTFLQTSRRFELAFSSFVDYASFCTRFCKPLGVLDLTSHLILPYSVDYILYKAFVFILIIPIIPIMPSLSLAREMSVFSYQSLLIFASFSPNPQSSYLPIFFFIPSQTQYLAPRQCSPTFDIKIYYFPRYLLNLYGFLESGVPYEYCTFSSFYHYFLAFCYVFLAQNQYLAYFPSYLPISTKNFHFQRHHFSERASKPTLLMSSQSINTLKYTLFIDYLLIQNHTFSSDHNILLVLRHSLKFHDVLIFYILIFLISEWDTYSCISYFHLFIFVQDYHSHSRPNFWCQISSSDIVIFLVLRSSLRNNILTFLLINMSPYSLSSICFYYYLFNSYVFLTFITDIIIFCMSSQTFPHFAQSGDSQLNIESRYKSHISSKNLYFAKTIVDLQKINLCFDQYYLLFHPIDSQEVVNVTPPLILAYSIFIGCPILRFFHTTKPRGSTFTTT